jgi:bacillolysin
LESVKKRSQIPGETERNKNNEVQIKVFPNPANDQFFIDANTTDKLNVSLFDVSGKKVLSENVNDKSNINVYNLQEGVYTVRIKTSGSIINKKLIILH